MNSAAPSIDRRPAREQAEAAFKGWLRKLVSGVAELRAFDAGEVDAVMDHANGCAVLLPDAHNAQEGSIRIALSALDALPGEVCVLDGSGTVVMTNKAWRAFAAHDGAGLRVREHGNFFAACRNAPEAERIHAEAFAVGLRQVLTGGRRLYRRRYVCTGAEGRRVSTMTIAVASGDGPLHAVVTRAPRSERPRSSAPRQRKEMRPIPDVAMLAAGAANRLLAALPAKEYERLAYDLEPVTLTYGTVLYEPGQRMSHVYFPTCSLVSLLTLVEGHRALEVGLVGREGLIGARLAFGATTSSVRALVQGTGSAFRMKATHFLREFRRSPTLRDVLLKFTDSLMIQVSQTAACNRFHVVEARLARWLLMTSERMARANFHLTHAFLADMLGVRRVGVTAAASALQRRRLIRYRRGDITIIDQQGLEAASCPCYRYVRLMGQDSAA